MTNQQDTALLLVTDADRDAAAQYLRYCGKITEHSFGDMQNGKWDASEYVQAFARHRLQSLEQAKPSASCEAEEVERVARAICCRGKPCQTPDGACVMHPDHYELARAAIAALSERGAVGTRQIKCWDHEIRDADCPTCRSENERGAVGEEVERLREALETIAQNDEFPLDDEGNRMPIRPQWSSHQCSSIARAALSSIRSGAGANSSGLADTPAEKG